MLTGTLRRALLPLRRPPLRRGMASPAAAAASSPLQDDTLVQYLLLRRDLKYGTGALVTQGAHASLAAVWETRDAPHTATYVAALSTMHKVRVCGNGRAKTR